MDEDKKCLYSFTYGTEKTNKGTFIKFAEQVIENEGSKLQQTMAIIKKSSGDFILVEPSCIKIIEGDSNV